MLVLFLAVSVKLLQVLDQLFQRVLQHFLDDFCPRAIECTLGTCANSREFLQNILPYLLELLALLIFTTFRLELRTDG